MAIKHNEIERKYLLDILPEFMQKCSHEIIEQGYIIADSNGTEVRIRHYGNKYYFTIKSGESLSRKEIEFDISKELFDTLWPYTNGRRIEKTRYRFSYAKYNIEVDVYSGNLIGLIIAEVEFADLNESSEFRPPPWFGLEVTDDKSYKNKNLASLSISDIQQRRK